MIFLKEDSRRIPKLIGRKRALADQFRKGAVGSPSCNIVSICSNGSSNDFGFHETRCIFEKFENGLLLRINSNQDLANIAIEYSKIEEMRITPGKERISPLFLSPMWILLKLGVNIRYARYFITHVSEYSIDPMKIEMKTDTGEMYLESSGYQYYSFKKYFNEIEKNQPAHNNR